MKKSARKGKKPIAAPSIGSPQRDAAPLDRQFLPRDPTSPQGAGPPESEIDCTARGHGICATCPTPCQISPTRSGRPTPAA